VYDGARADVTVALRGMQWRHRLSLQTPQHNETIDVFYIKKYPPPLIWVTLCETKYFVLKAC